MQIVCRDTDTKFKPPVTDWINNSICSLTRGKIYDVVSMDDFGYKIINDEYMLKFYNKHLFELLEEVRDRKLKLLI